MYRPTVAEINLNNLDYNLDSLRTYLGSCKILGVVKANAYGHGITDIAAALQKKGIDALGVAFADEGRLLREAGITVPILALYPAVDEEAHLFCEYNLDASACSRDFLNTLSEFAGLYNTTVRVHLDVDTGINRDGVRSDEALDFMRETSELPNIKYVGVYTHFATSPDDIDFARYQLSIFNNTLAELNSNGYQFELIHASNTGGIINLPEANFNMVRPGISMYGILPQSDMLSKISLKPIMTLKTKVIVVRNLKKGESVGYGRLFVAEKDTKIATIPLGYGDGFSKMLTGKAQCIIKGKNYDIVGSVCMDECMINVDDDDINRGDVVTIIGSDGDHSISVYDLADKIGTIPYEITTRITKRVPRKYLRY